MTVKLSVVIPTYNRCAVLDLCLNALAAQSLPPAAYEVLLIDDGSTDETTEIITAAQKRLSIEIRAYRQQNRGPATARNVGIREAKGSTILFLGDDIIAHPELLTRHIAHHEYEPSIGCAVLGFTTWSREITVTPFMQYLERGPQFNYGEIAQAPDNVPLKHFYTSNVSIAREQLLAVGLFDEAFPYAAQEDVELGYRLEQTGVRMIFEPQAMAYHYHPTSFEAACRRNITVGRATVLLAQRIPLGPVRTESRLKSLLRKPLVSMRALQLARRIGGASQNPRLWSVVLNLHLKAGVDRELQHQEQSRQTSTGTAGSQ